MVLHHLLLAVVGVHTVMILWTLRTDRRPDRRILLVICGGILGLVGLSAVWGGPWSGYGVGVVWLLVIILPYYAGVQLAVAQREANPSELARRTRWLQLLQPWMPWAEAQQMYAIINLTGRGAWLPALNALQAFQSKTDWIASWRQASIYALTNDWSALLPFLQNLELSDPDQRRAFESYRIRALAETNRWEACVDALDGLLGASRQQAAQLNGLLVSVSALAGNIAATQRYLAHFGAQMAPVLHTYWLGVACLRAADARGPLLLQEAAQDPDPLIQAQSQRHLIHDQAIKIPEPVNTRLAALLTV